MLRSQSSENPSMEPGQDDFAPTATGNGIDPSAIMAGLPTEATRFSTWVALSVLSLVAWFSLIGRTHSMDSSEKWSLAVTTLSMIFGCMGVACYIFARGMFLGQLPEIGLAGLLLAFWAGGLPVLMNPSNGIAVSFTEVVNANLYFSAWGAFVCIVSICGSLAKENFGYDLISLAAPMARSQQGHWYGLVASSVVALAASIRVLRAFDCKAEAMQKAPTCKETKYAISASVFATAVAMGATYMTVKGVANVFTECIMAAVALILWSFGLVFITFGEGPGHAIGNLYFATWASFLLSVLLFAETFRAYLAAKYGHNDNTDQEAGMQQHQTSMEDIPVEDDDDI